MDKVELYLNCESSSLMERQCGKCGDLLVKVKYSGDVDFHGIICLNEKCDYQLEALEGGRNNEENQ